MAVPILWNSFLMPDTLRFVAISDTHCKHRQIHLPKGDVLLHTGDVSQTGNLKEILHFLEWFARQRFKYKVFIAGNHDFYFETAAGKMIRELIPEGVIYLCDEGISIEGIRIWGSPVTPNFFNWAFNRKRGEVIRKHWELIPRETDILMTHGPVYGFLDSNFIDQHVGCQDLLRTVLTIKPRVHVCGHIHESYGSIKRSGIHFINACQVNEKYDLVNLPIVFDLKVKTNSN